MKESLPSHKWLEDLNKIIDEMLELQQDNGGFKNSENGKEGCFSTIEGLYPLLLYPQAEKFEKNIVLGINYILGNSLEGKIPTTPEYGDVLDNCSVDSMAYGLYVFALARNFFRKLQDPKHDELVTKITQQIKSCIKYITENQNNDNGWSFIKDLSGRLNSRTYSTALVTFALSNCEKEDFKKNKKKGRTLISEGVDFLLKHNYTVYNHHEKMWFFSEPREDDKEELKNLKRKTNVNLTSTVLFSLTHLLRTRWSEEKVPYILGDIIGISTQILKKAFKNSEVLPLNVEYEPVDYLAYDEKIGKVIIKTRGYPRNEEGFAHPYEMILPALLLTPGVSVKDKRLLNFRKKIREEIEDISRNVRKRWNLYEFSEKIFALLYHYYIETILEGCLDKFVKNGDVIRCLIDSYEKCPYVIASIEKCPCEGKIEECLFFKEYVKKRKSSTIDRLKDWWKNLCKNKLFNWTLIFLVEFSFTSLLLVYLEHYRFSLGVFWHIYAVIQGFIGSTMGTYYFYLTRKEKTEN